MVNGEAIAYNVSSFVCALFLLEFGADKFIDHTAVVAKRTGIPQTVVALLTAGAEWEEVSSFFCLGLSNRLRYCFRACRCRHFHCSPSIVYIVGSVIANILGAFSLGLICYKPNDGPLVFDKSSKLYTLVLLGFTGLIAGLTGFGHDILWRVVGGVIIGFFVVYLASIFWAIRKGLATAPELSDSDDEEFDDHDGLAITHSAQQRAQVQPTRAHGMRSSTGTGAEIEMVDRLERPHTALPSQSEPLANSRVNLQATEPEALGRSTQESIHSSASTSESDLSSNNTRHSLTYHVVYLTIGFLALVLSAYVLSTSASNLVDQFGISDVLFGVVILSIATTIPEKFVAVVSGFRGHMGIMVANTVGRNIFLLTLCMGILWTSTQDDLSQGSVNPVEIGVMLGCSALMTAIVWLGARWARCIGVAMLAAYIAFIV